MKTKTLKANDADDIDTMVRHWESKLGAKFTQTHVFEANGAIVYVYVLFYEGD